MIGFAFSASFEPRFEEIPATDQHIQLAALGLMLVGLAVLMITASYHRIVLHGRNT